MYRMCLEPWTGSPDLDPVPVLVAQLGIYVLLSKPLASLWETPVVNQGSTFSPFPFGFCLLFPFYGPEKGKEGNGSS